MKWTVRQLKRSEVIARMLVDRIRSSDLHDGDRLEPELIMMEELGTGRGSLREAFRILELSGVLEVRTGPTGGPVVRTPDISHFASTSSLFLGMTGATYREVMEASILLEPPIAALGARLGDPTRLEALQVALETEGAVDPNDGRAYMNAQAGFHDAVSQLANNRAVYLYLRGNHWITANLFGEVVAATEVQDEVFEAHKRAVEAICAGQAKRAETIMRRHLERSLAYTAAKFGSMIDQPVKWF